MYYCSIVYMFFYYNSKYWIVNIIKILIFYLYCNVDDMKVYYIEYIIIRINKLILLLKIIFKITNYEILIFN